MLLRTNSNFLPQPDQYTEPFQPVLRPVECPTDPIDRPPEYIDAHHWDEWISSHVHPDLIRANVLSLEGSQPFDYLCYSDRLARNSIGRLELATLRRYAHTEDGGWWCQSLDPLNDWQPMLWGCFKPDRPRLDPEKGKPIKYEHPPKASTRAFFLAVSWRIGLKIARQHGLETAYQRRLQRDLGNDWPDRDLSEVDPGFWSWIHTQVDCPIVLTEGAKKAGCLLSQGYVAIGLPGIFNGRRAERDLFGRIQQETLIPELEVLAQAERPIAFCFDHDSKPQTIQQVNHAIWSTGKLLEQFQAIVRVISLPGPEKGVDDFIAAQGSHQFAQVYRSALPIAIWHWQITQQSELRTPAWYTLHQPELDLSQVPNLPTQGILVLESAKGTGKTKAIAQLVQQQPKVIALGHRIALMRNLCDRLGLDYKGDLDKAEGRFFNDWGYTQLLGLCVDSLLSINPDQFQGGVLVIDEFMQVLRHLLMSQTCNQGGKRSALLERFQQIVRAAKWIIVADADAADIGILYLEKLRGQPQETYLIRNTFQPIGFPTQLLDSPREDAIYAAIIRDVLAGKRVFIAMDWRHGSKTLNRLLRRLFESNRPGLLINSETSGEEAARRFITNPNQWASQYQWVIATPSLCTGVSIEVEHFDVVYGVFQGVNTDSDIAQALNRVRARVPRVLWVPKRGKNFCPVSTSDRPEPIAESLRQRMDAESALLRTSLLYSQGITPELDRVSWENNPHVQLFTELAARNNGSMWNLRQYVIARLMHEGNEVEVTQVEANLPLREEIKIVRAQLKAEDAIAVAQARRLSESEVAALRRQETLSQDDRQAIEKTQAIDFLCQDEITPEDVEFYRRYHSKLIQLEALIWGAELAIQRDREAEQRQTRWGCGSLPFDRPFHELRRTCRDRLGLLQFLDPEKTWTSQDLQPFADQIRQYRKAIRDALNVNIPKSVDNGWILQTLIQQVGLKMRSFRRGRRGQQVKHFGLDPVHYARVMQVLERRYQRRSCCPVEPQSVVTPLISLLIGQGHYPTAAAAPSPVVTPPLSDLKERGHYASIEPTHLPDRDPTNPDLPPQTAGKPDRAERIVSSNREIPGQSVAAEGTKQPQNSPTGRVRVDLLPDKLRAFVQAVLERSRRSPFGQFSP